MHAARSALASRIFEVGLENFMPRSPFNGDLEAEPLVPLRNALACLPLSDKGVAFDTALVKVPQAADGPLSKEEGMSIHLYTRDWGSIDSSLHFKLNRALRHVDRFTLKPYLKFLKIFMLAISRLSRNEEKIYWRGVGLDLFDVYFERIGHEIIFWGFSSVTPDVRDLDQFLPQQSVPVTLFCIRSRLAVNISKYSAFSKLEETIIPAATLFRVLDVKRVEEDVTIIELVEVRNLLGLQARENEPFIEHGIGAVTFHTTSAESPSTDVRKNTFLLESAAPLTQAASSEPNALNSYSHDKELDEPESLRFHRLAAEQGDRNAQYNLGWCFSEGRGGFPKDEREALKWYKLSADQGCSYALYNMGVYHEYGRGGLQKDAVCALRWYQLAADAGDEFAQSRIAVFYELGLGGLTKDMEMAKKMYQISANNGDEFSQQKLLDLEQRGLE